MRPDETNRPARYHRGHLDTDWQKDLILPFQMNRRYKMPVELGDPFRFQLKSTPFFGHSLQLVDCNGRFVYTFDVSATAAVDGDTTPDGTQYSVYHYALSEWDDISTAIGHQLPEGTYYIVYRISYDGSTQTVFISEPIHVKEYHPDTVLIEYWHDSYKYGIPFSTIPAKFRKRIKGYVDQYVPKSISTVYQDQNSDTTTLDYAPYRAWRLYAGRATRGAAGIADWELDKLNRIMGCDHILIDGKAFTPSTANPTWNIEPAQTNPLKVADIEIQEAEDSEDFTISDQSFALFATGTYPYAIGHIKIGGFPVSGAIRIANSGAETTAIATWNSALIAAELTGSITKVGSIIYYNNGPGERYTSADVARFTAKFSFVYTLLSAGALSIQLANSFAVVYWGDGTAEESITTTNTIYNHSYSGAGILSVEVWGSTETFVVSQSGTSNLTGTIPAQLRVLSVGQMTFTSNAFDFTLLSPCRLALVYLSLTNCGLVAANNMPAYQFPKLAQVYFQANALPQTVMNLLIADVKGNAYTNNIFNGNLNVSAQSPPVTLNPTGTAAKTALQAYGWTVIN